MKTERTQQILGLLDAAIAAGQPVLSAGIDPVGSHTLAQPAL